MWPLLFGTNPLTACIHSCTHTHFAQGPSDLKQSLVYTRISGYGQVSVLLFSEWIILFCLYQSLNTYFLCAPLPQTGPRSRDAGYAR